MPDKIIPPHAFRRNCSLPAETLNRDIDTTSIIIEVIAHIPEIARANPLQLVKNWLNSLADTLCPRETCGFPPTKTPAYDSGVKKDIKVPIKHSPNIYMAILFFCINFVNLTKKKSPL